MTSEQEHPQPKKLLESFAFRNLSATGLIVWIAVFALLWAYAPSWVKLLSLLWSALGFFIPDLYLLSLALAIPFFGNNPGGEHHLYLLDMGLIGFVARDLSARVLGRRTVRAIVGFASMNALVRLFVLVSALALIPQHRHIYCEMRSYGWRIFYGIFAEHYANSPVFGLRSFLNLALSASLFAALRDRPPSPAWQRRIWLAFLLALGAASLVGVLEYFGLISVSWWRPENPYITRFGYRRLQSLFWHSGWFGQYLAALAPAALSFGLTTPNQPRKWGWLALSAFFGVTQLLTMQRGEWLALTAGYGTVLAVFAWRNDAADRRRFLRQTGLALVGAIFLALLLALTLAPLRHRMGEMARLEDRWLIWSSALKLGMKDPWAGIGIGNYTPAHVAAFKPDDPHFAVDNKTTAHSVYLQLFAERGIFGVVLFVLLYFGAILASRRALAANRGKNVSLSLALIGGLSALAVDGIFQYFFYLRVIELIFWILLAWTTHAISDASPPARHRSFNGLWWIAALAIFTAMTWRQRYRFGDWMFYADGANYIAGPGIVRLDLAKHASTVQVPVFSFDPEIKNGSPIVFAFWLGETLLATQVFEDYHPAVVTLNLPKDRDSRTKLVIRSSRVWQPYLYTWREIPVLESGVCYRPPRAARQNF